MSILKILDEVKNNNKDITQKAFNYFLPLRERFVTRIRKYKIIEKKFLWLKLKSYEESYNDYIPLCIDVTSDGKVIFVKITYDIRGNMVPLWIGKEFPVSVFEDSDLYTSPHESIKDFIIKISISGITPKYVNYDAFVGHIRDENKKLYVSNKLEELFASDEYVKLKNTLADQVKIGDYLCEKVKEWENE